MNTITSKPFVFWLLTAKGLKMANNTYRDKLPTKRSKKPSGKENQSGRKAGIAGGKAPKHIGAARKCRR